MESLLNRLYDALGPMRQKMSHCLSLMMGYRFILMNPIIHWKCAVPLCHCLTTS